MGRLVEIGRGARGVIYKFLDENSVVKIPIKEAWGGGVYFMAGSTALRESKRGLDLLDLFYRGGISVPRPIGLFGFLLGGTPETATTPPFYETSGVKMEYIIGEKLSNKTNRFEEYVNLAEEELMRAAEIYAGFLRKQGKSLPLNMGSINRSNLLRDFELWNILCVEDKRRIVLVDVDNLPGVFRRSNISQQSKSTC